MISLLFFILASVANAIMDTCSHHYSTSVFKKLNPMFWNNEISWRSKYIDNDPTKGKRKIFNGLLNFPVQLTDAFHFFKSLMIIFICFSIATFDLNFLYIFDYWICVLIVVTVYGTLWNITFSLFYNRILRRK